MAELQLSAIYCYPVKSAAGHSLPRASLDQFGIVGDRRWMLIDDQGRFLSQRSLPAMAQLGVQPLAEGIRLHWQGDSCDVTTPNPGGECVLARVWEDTVVSPLAAPEASNWLSACLGQSLRLVHCPDGALRGVDPGYAPPGQLVAFSDGFPLLIVGQASLDSLNERLPVPVPVPMDRFRPNLVISGGEPHAEDQWQTLRIGAATVSLVKPCSRCAIPSIDQASGQRDPQVNRVLASYRRRDGVIYFGMNAFARAGVTFSVGDAVEIVD